VQPYTNRPGGRGFGPRIREGFARSAAVAAITHEPHIQPKLVSHAASTRFCADAFAEQPKLADDPRTLPRYSAAYAAVLTAAGKGKDADKLDAKERTRLRKQALDWLRADLAMWSKLLDKATHQQRTQVQKTLTHWTRDADFVTVRDKEALAQLPEEERAAWQKLWADVDALLAKARPAK
jgi:hypothetical protein